MDLAPIVLDRHGNTASAGSIIACHLHHEDLTSGDIGVICSFGAGYSIFIGEFDKLPSEVIDRLVALFRDMYLNRSHYRIHGLALIGGKAVLGTV